MTHEHLLPHLSASASEVFEKMIFLDVKQVDRSALRPIDKWECTGLLKFSGEIKGCLGLQCRQALAKEATLSLLGIDESELTPEKLEDTVRELTNMICGSLFCALDEDRSRVQLSVPDFFRDALQAGLGFEENYDWVVLPFVCGTLLDESGREEQFLLGLGLEKNKSN